MSNQMFTVLHVSHPSNPGAVPVRLVVECVDGVSKQYDVSILLKPLNELGYTVWESKESFPYRQLDEMSQVQALLTEIDALV